MARNLLAHPRCWGQMNKYYSSDCDTGDCDTRNCDARDCARCPFLKSCVGITLCGREKKTKKRPT